MPNSSAKTLPYPATTDPVAQGADAIRKLAQSVDNMVQTGSVTVNVVTAGTNAQTAVVFPVPYASPPTVFVGPTSGPPSDYSGYWWPSGVTATGFNAVYKRSTTGNFTGNWVAVGAVAPVT